MICFVEQRFLHFITSFHTPHLTGRRPPPIPSRQAGEFLTSVSVGQQASSNSQSCGAPPSAFAGEHPLLHPATLPPAAAYAPEEELNCCSRRRRTGGVAELPLPEATRRINNASSPPSPSPARLLRRRRRPRQAAGCICISSMETKLQEHPCEEPSKLSYQLIKQITNDFDEKRILGSGGFGTVYKGVHESRGDIAVKVLHTISGLDDKEFHKEFNNLRGLKHQNIVELIGFCKESEEELVEFEGKQVTATRIHMALCFEYVHNGSLNKLISDEKRGFNWQTRYRIIKGICEGLKYLREGLEHPIMHFDLKPDNILLDKNMVPKVADFGLSKLFGEDNTQKTMSSIGTCGYWPPEYVKHQIISKEFDIFSLGVIIVKIMTGHAGYNQVVEMPARKSITLVQKKWIGKLSGSCTPLFEVYCYQVKRCIEIALDCLKSNRQERPTIEDIVSSLNETETVISDQGLHIEKLNQNNLEESIIHSIRSIITSEPTSGHGETINLFKRLKAMTLEEVKYMTGGFSEERLLAKGRSGKVYKGICEDGQVLALKVLIGMQAVEKVGRSTRWHGLIEFETQNIVRLVGHCHGTQKQIVEHKEKGYVYAEETQRIFCFEYLPNGSLERHISDVHSGLDWRTRYGIIKGTCMGLLNLHHGYRHPIYHFNLKPSNILLDENMQPKIDDIIYDFETFLRILPEAKVGPLEYMPPEYIEKQIRTKWYDIYSLGVVIIEIMTGNRYSLGSLQMSSKEFFDHACVNWRERLQETVQGSSVEGYYRQVKKCLEIALKCMETDRHKRPTIKNIINMLNQTETLIHTEPLLNVHPLELCFLPYINKKAMIYCLLQLENKGNDRVAFMLMANSPKMYMPKKPLCGAVPPRCAYTLTVTMPNKQQLVPSSSKSLDSGGDFFTLCSVVLGRYDLLDVDKDHVANEYETFFEMSGEEMQVVMLNVISNSDGPAPVDEETSLSSEPTRPMVEIIAMPEAREVSSIDVHPTEPWIMTTNHVGSLRVWNYNTMATMNSLQLVEYEPVHVAKFIAREKWIVAGDDNGAIHVYNYDQNQHIGSFDSHNGCITSLAVHQTDPFVLSSSSNDDDHLIKLWDWDKGWECIRTFQGHTDKVTQVTFNPKSKESFASTSWDGTVKIWSICSDGTSNIITLKLDDHGLCVDYFTRHNRQHLIVGCKDRTAEIWKLGMKECVDKLEGHADPISVVSLHPELPILITGSLDGTVRLWNSTTYKLENIIGFNLGAVYAFGCIEGTRRIVVGCHQGVATMEIYSP